MFGGGVLLNNDINIYLHVVNLWTWNPNRNDSE